MWTSVSPCQWSSTANDQSVLAMPGCHGPVHEDNAPCQSIALDCLKFKPTHHKEEEITVYPYTNKRRTTLMCQGTRIMRKRKSMSTQGGT
jgi:hypothetical protein